jgi:hypothetical protein
MELPDVLASQTTLGGPKLLESAPHVVFLRGCDYLGLYVQVAASGNSYCSLYISAAGVIQYPSSSYTYGYYDVGTTSLGALGWLAAACHTTALVALDTIVCAACLLSAKGYPA